MQATPSLATLGFILLLFVLLHPNHTGKKLKISVVSKRVIGKAKRYTGDNNKTVQGHIARNKMDTHVDTYCSGANWTPMHYTGEIFEVSPFLNTYSPVKEIPYVWCCTVCTDDEVKEYLLVGDEMLWFRTALENLLINPNQICAYGLSINDDPFNANEIDIDGEELFILFNATGTVVHLESHVPMEWETTHLPVILITEDSWDPTTVDMSASKRSQEDAEMQTIRSLTSSMIKRAISDMLRDHSISRQVHFGKTVHELTKIAAVFDERTFCRRFIGAVNIATTFRDDIDGWE